MKLSIDTLREHYLRAQLVGDRREALRIVLDDGLRGGTSILELQTGVVQAAQVQLGQLWQQRRVTVAQEHMATAISELALSALFERAEPRPRLGKKLVIACVEGEVHELPARLVADMLDLEGFEIRFLGANVPHEDLASSVKAERPDAIALSVTVSSNIDELRRAVERVRAVSTAPIIVGGRAVPLSPNVPDELRVATDGTKHDELLASALRLVGL